MIKPLNETQELIHEVSDAARAAGVFRDPVLREATTQVTAIVVLHLLHRSTGLTGHALIARAVREIEAGHVYA